MAKGIGKRQRASMLNWILGKTPADTEAGILWVALHEGDPGDDGQSGTEGNGTGYARVSAVATDWNAATDASPSVSDNANAVTFPTAGGDWNSGNDFTHYSLWASLSGATEADFVGRGELTTPQPVLNGQTPSFPSGAIRLTLDETA